MRLYDLDAKDDYLLDGRYAVKSSADVQPVHHAHWIEKTIRGSDALVCSKCLSDSGVGYAYSYCPNCGAEMDEEIDEDE